MLVGRVDYKPIRVVVLEAYSREKDETFRIHSEKRGLERQIIEGKWRGKGMRTTTDTLVN